MHNKKITNKTRGLTAHFVADIWKCFSAKLDKLFEVEQVFSRDQFSSLYGTVKCFTFFGQCCSKLYVVPYTVMPDDKLEEFSCEEGTAHESTGIPNGGFWPLFRQCSGSLLGENLEPAFVPAVSVDVLQLR